MTDLKMYVYNYNEKIHPLKLVQHLGIGYQFAVPQTLGDMWQFWNCTNVPKDLPIYFTREQWDPMEWIGYGLTKEMADEILEWRKKL